MRRLRYESMMPANVSKIPHQCYVHQELNPELPLGTAEQFLITLSSITGLEARLRLWAFKMDFEVLEKEICEPLADLKLGLEALSVNPTFKSILNVTLTIGNFLNGSSAKGFNIDYLAKVAFELFKCRFNGFAQPGSRSERHGPQALSSLPSHLLRP